ncbi:unnamed protein product [Paramecium sonneborni]|uniref:Uncharacterized protein n=1 Tax=Paramecium sonneborni TaxID=65129 RepID=A0A8S1LN11_9CILI|nr:unnamed protein product [Paramecium sonneborni]
MNYKLSKQQKGLEIIKFFLANTKMTIIDKRNLLKIHNQFQVLNTVIFGDYNFFYYLNRYTQGNFIFKKQNWKKRENFINYIIKGCILNFEKQKHFLQLLVQRIYCRELRLFINADQKLQSEIIDNILNNFTNLINLRTQLPLIFRLVNLFQGIIKMILK